MVITQVRKVSPKQRKRKSLFPRSFAGLMRSTEYQGKGAALAQNVILKDGRLEKMPAPSILLTRANTDGIRWQAGFKNADEEYLDLYLIDSGLTDKYIMEAYNLSTGATTYPVLSEANEVALTGAFTFTNGSANVSIVGGAALSEVAVGDSIFSDGEYSDRVRVLSITDNDNVVLESNYGGAGGSADGKSATKHFSTTRLYLRQLGDEAYLATYEATDNGFSFDGTTLTNVANFPAYARYLLLDGNRLAVNEEFSQEASATLTSFTGGSGVQVSGAYATSLTANGGIETSAGIILMGDMIGELHKVIPNNSSNDVSAETKLNSFNYTGQGIQNAYQIIMGKNFAYIINTKGIVEINPFSGESRILTDDGNIRRRWAKYDVEDAIINYDSKDNKIVGLVKDVGQYDTLVLIDLDFKERPVSVQPNSFIESIANINNQLYGGSSIDGKILKMFNTYSDRDDNPLQFRWILEWDALEGISTENVLKQLRIHHNLNSKSQATLKLYKNGSQEPIVTKVIQGSSSQESQVASVIGTSGFYLSGLGGNRLAAAEESTDLISKLRKTARVVTYTLEILEESVYNYKVYDVIVEFKSRSILTREKVQPNTLF